MGRMEAKVRSCVPGHRVGGAPGARRPGRRGLICRFSCRRIPGRSACCRANSWCLSGSWASSLHAQTDNPSLTAHPRFARVFGAFPETAHKRARLPAPLPSLPEYWYPVTCSCRACRVVRICRFLPASPERLSDPWDTSCHRRGAPCVRHGHAARILASCRRHFRPADVEFSPAIPGWCGQAAMVSHGLV